MSRRGLIFSILVWLVAAVVAAAVRTAFAWFDGFQPVVYEDNWYSENAPFSPPVVAEWAKYFASSVVGVWVIGLFAWGVPNRFAAIRRFTRQPAFGVALAIVGFASIAALLTLAIGIAYGELIHGESNARTVLHTALAYGLAGGAWGLVMCVLGSSQISASDISVKVTAS